MVTRRKIDGLTYTTKFRMEVDGYEAPLFELRQPYGVKMTQKGWEDGIPGSCTNCALTVSARKDGVKAIWIARTVAYLLFKLDSGVAFFKAKDSKGH